jgi:hypothetical protein
MAKAWQRPDSHGSWQGLSVGLAAGVIAANCYEPVLPPAEEVKKAYEKSSKLYLQTTRPLRLQSSFLADAFFELIVSKGEHAAVGVVDKNYFFGAKESLANS